MDNELSQTPKYKIAGPDSQPVNGIIHPVGSTFESKGWPPNSGFGLEGVNEPGRRILEFLQGNSNDAFKPDTPWNDDVVGGFYLPGRSADPRGVAIAVLSPERITAGMPRYRAEMSIDDNPYEEVRRFPHHPIKRGEKIVTLDWPRFFDGEFTPDNIAAKQVVAYYAKAKKNPHILPSPWNWFTRALCLPALPSASQWGEHHAAVADMTPEREAA